MCANERKLGGDRRGPQNGKGPPKNGPGGTECYSGGVPRTRHQKSPSEGRLKVTLERSGKAPRLGHTKCKLVNAKKERKDQ